MKGTKASVMSINAYYLLLLIVKANTESSFTLMPYFQAERWIEYI